MGSTSNATYCDASTLYQCGPDKVSTTLVRDCPQGCTQGACVGAGGASGAGGDSGTPEVPAEGGTAGTSEGVPSDAGTAVDAEDPCSAEPCENGSCTAVGDTYECSCDDGYEGDNCETNVDDCAPNPCENGGRCDDRIAGYDCVCATAFTGSHCELPRFELIPNGPTAVNGDGSVIVGYGFDNDDKRWAYRWRNHLTERLEALPGEEEAEAHDVSEDGSVIFGRSGARGALWIDGEAIPLDPLTGFENVNPLALSADGSVSLGRSYNPGDASSTTVWHKRTQPTDPGLGDAFSEDINGDGSVIVGSTVDNIAFRYANDTLEPLPVPQECVSAHAIATNKGGDTIAGACYQAVGSRPIRWVNDVPEVLAPPPEAIWEQGYMELYALSADGNAGVGEAFNAADGDLMPVIWSAERGMSWFRVVLREFGVDPSAYTRIDLEAISGDGKTVVGWLTDGVEWHGYIFRLD